jgi:hypothetical protein
VDVSALQAHEFISSFAVVLEEETGGSSMSQCPYMIKNAVNIGWSNCQLEAGHNVAHKPDGRENSFAGQWFKPGDPSSPPDLGFFSVVETL